MTIKRVSIALLICSLVITINPWLAFAGDEVVNDSEHVSVDESTAVENADSTEELQQQKVSKKVTGLKGGKKYYVKIRTYKTVSGTKYYSPWSKSKTVTTKK